MGGARRLRPSRRLRCERGSLLRRSDLCAFGGIEFRSGAVWDSMLCWMQRILPRAASPTPSTESHHRAAQRAAFTLLELAPILRVLPTSSLCPGRSATIRASGSVASVAHPARVAPRDPLSVQPFGGPTSGLWNFRLSCSTSRLPHDRALAPALERHCHWEPNSDSAASARLSRSTGSHKFRVLGTVRFKLEVYE